MGLLIENNKYSRSNHLTTIETGPVTNQNHRNQCHHSHHQYYSSHVNQDKNNDSYDDDNDNIDDGDDYADVDDDDDVDVNSTDSIETVSDELPVWAFGEQRWISGVNEDTTCSDLINVLLADEGIIPPSYVHQHHNHHHHHHQHNNIKHQQYQKQLGLPGNFLTTKLHDSDLQTTTTTATLENNNKIYAITERWRRVEQILSDDTKVLQIWSAWGQAKSEVKLTLRQIDPSLSLDISGYSNNNDKDSGMGSPIGSSNSAIMRRRKHRASKSTAAWVTQAYTMHPKSQKTQIEKLMKLILEQGETIQQQLAKLRDRELQIAKIEEERHKSREKEHGKNYLLETYLNGLHEVEEKEVVTGNSDSGVQTEGALSSPEICSSSNQNEDEDYVIETGTQSISVLASLPTPKIQKQNPKYYENNTNISYLKSQPTSQCNSEMKISSSLPINRIRSSSLSSFPFKEKPSHREKKLLKEHKQAKEYSSYLLQHHNEANANGLSANMMMTSNTTTLLPSLPASSSSSASIDTLNATKKQNQIKQTKYFSVHLTDFNEDDDKQTSVDFQNRLSSEIAKITIDNSDLSESNTGHDNNNNSKIKDLNNDDNLSEKIQWMEKLVMINKHLQREEELLVRLGAKIRKYESENPLLDETQIREQLCKVNNHLETGNMEIEKLELDLLATKEQLENKSKLLHTLSKELIEKENDQLQQLSINVEERVSTNNTNITNMTSDLLSKVCVEEKKIDKKKSETRKVGFSNSIKVVDIPLDDEAESELELSHEEEINIHQENNDILKNLDKTCTRRIEINNNNTDEQDYHQKASIRKISLSNTADNLPNLNKNDLVENLYNYSQYISKPNYDYNEKNENKKNKTSDEKLSSITFPNGANTLPLRSKTSTTTGILKNKNTSSFINNNQQSTMLLHQPHITEQSNRTTNGAIVSSSLTHSSQTSFIAPPPPGFDSPNYYNSNNDLLRLTIPPEADQLTNQQYQKQLATTSFVDDSTNEFSLNHAKNVNFSKPSAPIINYKNINPTSLSNNCKSDVVSQKLLCFNDNPHSQLNLATNNTTLNYETTMLNDRSLPAVISHGVPPSHISNSPSTTTTIVGVSENFLSLKKNYHNNKNNSYNHRHQTNCNQMHNNYAIDLTGGDSLMLHSSNNVKGNLIIQSEFGATLPTITSRNSVNEIHGYHGSSIVETLPSTAAAAAGTTSINLIHNQENRNIANIGNLSNNIIIGSNTNKLGSKRFINTTGGVTNEFESNSDTGLSSLSDDVAHLGTLV